MGKYFILIPLLACFLTFPSFWSESVYALDYGYKLQVDPLTEHIIAKPSFKTIATSFFIENQGDPVYLSLISTSGNGLNVQTKTDTTRELNIGGKTTFLLTKNEKAVVNVQISNKLPALQVQDYIVDIAVQWARPEFTSDKTISASLRPSIHKRIIVSASHDGKLSIDPKIAFFRNSRGTLMLDSNDASIILTVQNRGIHTLPLRGTLYITNPSGEIRTYPIIYSHIAPGNQAYMLTNPAQNPEGVLLTIPSNQLRAGKYSIRAELFYPQATQPDLYANSTFWVIPQLLLVVFGLTLAILLSMVIFMFLRHT